MTLTAPPHDITWSVEDAYRFCERLARSHYENFTVGSRLLPKGLRPHVYAIYAYCRTVDDLGDEFTASDPCFPRSSKAIPRMRTPAAWLFSTGGSPSWIPAIPAPPTTR